MEITFKGLLKLLGFVMKFLKWSKWKKRAQDAEDSRKLEDERNEAEDRIRKEGDNIARPDKGSDKDLLNSGR